MKVEFNSKIGVLDRAINLLENCSLPLTDKNIRKKYGELMMTLTIASPGCEFPIVEEEYDEFDLSDFPDFEDEDDENIDD